MKKSFFVFLVAVFAVLAPASVVYAGQSSAEDIAKFWKQQNLDRWFILEQSPTQKRLLEKCQKTPKRFWYITNVGTRERPLLKGFCRIAHEVSPFADIG